MAKGPYRGKAETQASYEARRRAEGLSYLTRCPTCFRCMVWAEPTHDPRWADHEGYEVFPCGICQSRKDNERYHAQASAVGRRNAAEQHEEDLRRARVAQGR